jgi:nucleoside-diphosphate-sugar epimerase
VKTFITGGTGFIGTHVVRRLAQTGHEMVCLVRETSDVSTLEEVGATLVRGDGSKAEVELGITYTPIRVAIEEATASYAQVG